MLRVPLRLAANLARARIAQKLRRNSEHFPVLPLIPVQQPISPDNGAGKIPATAIPGTELLAAARNSSAPVMWISGSDPLHHPEIGQLARCLTGLGRHVFLETDGALLRRRIHEFRPVSRLFLTLHLDGLGAAHDLRAGRPGAFQLATEGMRAARLSGFQLCIHARVEAQTELAQIVELIEFARSLDVDGFVISSAARSPNSALPSSEALRCKAAEAVKLIHNSWWESFSWLLEPVLSGAQHGSPSAAEPNFRLDSESSAEEEGVNLA